MGFLRGLGRAMTALGQDLGRTKREDEERQRKEDAIEAERAARNQLGQDLAGVSSGMTPPGSPGYRDLAGRAMEFGVDAGSYVPELVPEPYSSTGDYGGQYGRWNERTGEFDPAPEGSPVPELVAPTLRSQGGELGSVTDNKWTGVEDAPVAEPAPVRWNMLPAEEDGLMRERHPLTGEVRPVTGPDGTQLRHRPTGGGLSPREQIVRDALGGDDDSLPVTLLERQQEWDEAMAAGLARGMSREEVEIALPPRPTG